MKYKTRDLVTSGVLLGISIVISTAIHMSGIDGSIFLPMHIPVMIAGFLLGPSLGLIVGFLSPLLNHALTGMPPIPVLWIMLVELSIYGLISGYLYKRLNMNLIFSLIISMIIGRMGAALTILLLGQGFGLPMPPLDIYVYGMTLTAIPGIIIQIILIPILIKTYEKYRE
ncbi:ECF transporter S component [Schnuerera sp. xch1]|uniref:ECF transporter S component n=1 Tax=Schnuerera sp. xch1 TaxID=2874283 RepID=UPI001CC0AD78|nr:ECF transporter S component [Schnuerera sp. xch1]MBZ2175115.1 ECF transporter S component [Schnuerera sp. xch1]